MVIFQGEIWWADLPRPTGSGPGFRRPVVVVQCDALNRNRLATTRPGSADEQCQMGRGSRQCAPLTGLPKDSVPNVSQIVAVDKDSLNGAGREAPASKA
jgi:mRNA interferase MazF